MSIFNIGKREIFYILQAIRHYRKELLASEDHDFEDVVNDLKILDSIENKLESNCDDT